MKPPNTRKGFIIKHYRGGKHYYLFPVREVGGKWEREDGKPIPKGLKVYATARDASLDICSIGVV